jgi:hypothetical protein
MPLIIRRRKEEEEEEKKTFAFFKPLLSVWSRSNFGALMIGRERERWREVCLSLSNWGCSLSFFLLFWTPAQFEYAWQFEIKKQHIRLIRMNWKREIIQLIPPTNSSRTKIIIDFQMMRTCSLVLSFVCVHLLRMFVPFASCRSMIRHDNQSVFLFQFYS